ncbi:MAG: hypothetical protein Q7P63_04070 [Verrucomicrobiota bacterium JB022]|nr:hypothetical protein [Verrucomicrobiota bacterium JB022]
MKPRGRFELWIAPTRVRLQGTGVRQEVAVAPGADAQAVALELAREHCAPGSELKIFSAALSLFVTRWESMVWPPVRPPAEVLPLEPRQLHWVRQGPWLLVVRKEALAAWLAEFARAHLWVTKLVPLMASHLPDDSPAREVRLIDDQKLGWAALLVVYETFVRVEPLASNPETWPEAIASARTELNREEPESVPVYAWQNGERRVPPVEGLKGLGEPSKLSMRFDLRDPQSRNVADAALWCGPFRAAAAALTLLVAFQAYRWQELREEAAQLEAEQVALEARLAELKGDRFMRIDLPWAEATGQTLAPARREEERLQRMLEVLNEVAQPIPNLHFTAWRLEGDTVTLSGLIWSFNEAEADRDPEVPANFQVLLDRLDDRLGVEIIQVEPQEPGRLAFTFRLGELP